MSRKWSKVVVAGFAAAAIGGLAIAGSASASPWSDLGTVEVTGHASALLRVCAKSGNQTISVQGANQNGASVTTPWQTIGQGSCEVVGYQNTSWWWQIGSMLTLNELHGQSQKFGIGPYKSGFFTASGTKDGGTFTIAI
jgi:hypothetical protein